MSMHRIPLTALEELGLRNHGLDIGTPSQLSDVFRHGIAWALSQQTDALERMVQEIAKAEQRGRDSVDRYAILSSYTAKIRTEAYAAGREAMRQECVKMVKSQKYMTLHPTKTFAADEIVRACRSTGDGIATLIEKIK